MSAESEQGGADKRPRGAESLLKALDVIEVIARSAVPMKVAAIAGDLQMPRATAYRIVGALAQRGYLRKHEDSQSYSLGYRMFELSFSSWNDLDIASVAAPTLEALRDLTGETVVLSMRTERAVIVIDKRDSKQTIRPAIGIGHTEPLDGSLLGQSILAFMSAEQRQDALAGAGYAALPDLEFQLRLSAARGYGIEHSQFDDALTGIAVPIRDFLGAPFASVAVIGPAQRLSETRLHQLSPHVTEAAREITRNTGSPVQSIKPRPKPQGRVPEDLEVVSETASLLGESPVWDERNGRLYWIDIFGPTVHEKDVRTGASRQVTCTELPGAVALTEAGDLLVAQSDALLILDGETLRPKSSLLDTAGVMAGRRFNDGAVAPSGELCLGIMDLGVKPDGGEIAILRVGADRFETSIPGMTLPNGIRWSPDGRTLFVVDSRKGALFRFTWNPETGTPGPKQVFATIPESQGMPDGIAVDAEGCVWVAIWDGWSLARFDPEGTLLETCVLPVPRPTSLCFGGDDMGTLFVTTASVRLTADLMAMAPLSGKVLALRPGVKGATETQRFVDRMG